uniref:Rho-GAP domain-containing protein n=1 Tax=Chrysolophus pictus TaxID=9089 RepID=A0A8C3LCD7_CHRPC
MHNTAPHPRPQGFARTWTRTCNQAQLWRRVHNHAQGCTAIHNYAARCPRPHSFAQPQRMHNHGQQGEGCTTLTTMCKAAWLCTSTKKAMQPSTAMEKDAQPCTAMHKDAQPCTGMHSHAQPWRRMHNYAQECTTMHNHGEGCTAMHNHAQECTAMHNHGEGCTAMHNHTQSHTTMPKAARLCTTTKQDSQPQTARRRMRECTPSPAPCCTRAHKCAQGRWGSTEAEHTALPCGFSTPRQEAAPKEAERGASKLRQGCARGSELHFLPPEQSRGVGGPWAGGGDPPGVPAVPMSLALKARQKAKRKGGGAKEKVFGCDLLEHLQQSGKDVPQVLRSCTEFVEQHGVVDGIYRLSGVSSNIQRLR